MCLSAVSQAEHSQSGVDSSGVNDELSSDILAEAIEQPSKTPRRLTDGLQILFSPHGRFVVSTLQGIQEEQQRLGNAITALRVNSCLFVSHVVQFCFMYLCIARKKCWTLVYINGLTRLFTMFYGATFYWDTVYMGSAWRSQLGRRFFRSVTVSDSCLHDLLPQRRDSEILSRL